jgi:polar amino acid transport system substrate-binding protein
VSLRSTALSAAIVSALALAAAGCSTGSTSSGAAASPAALSGDTPTAAAGSPSSLVPAAIRKAGVLTVGTSAPDAPMTYFEADGKTYTGVEVDVVTAIAKGLGLDVKWVNADWKGLIPALTSGRYDVVAADVADYTDREKLVTFVNYFRSGAEVVVPADKKSQYTSLTDLCGKTLGAGAGSDNLNMAQNVSASCTAQGKPAIDIKVFSGGGDDLLAVRSGRIDGVVMDQTEAEYQAGTTEDGKVFADVLPNIDPQVPMVGLAVPPAQTDLVKALSDELDVLIANGEYAKILAKYHVAGGALEHATVNGGTVASNAAGS